MTVSRDVRDSVLKCLGPILKQYCQSIATNPAAKHALIQVAGLPERTITSMDLGEKMEASLAEGDDKRWGAVYQYILASGWTIPPGLETKPLHWLIKDYGYTWEKLHAALLSLVGDGELSRRLEYAWTGALIRLADDDFPPELRERFAALKLQVTAASPKGDEGSIAASSRAMSLEVGTRHAEGILSLYFEIMRRRAPY